MIKLHLFVEFRNKIFNMEELEEINQGEKNLCLEEMCNQIQAIGKWYKFFAILSIISACSMVICGIFLVVIGTLAMSNPMFYFIDDAAIIAAAITQIKKIGDDLKKYKDWKSGTDCSKKSR